MNEIQELHRQGLNISQIGQLLGLDRKTVRKYMNRLRAPVYGPRPTRATLLTPFETFIQARLAAGVWNAAVLLGELRQQGYAGGYTILCDYLRPLRKEAVRVAVRRFETAPGQQGQVDWGVLGQLLTRSQERLTLSAFVMTLGYSRAMYVGIATDQRLETFLRMHEAAFDYLGGAPEQLLYDNCKTVVLGRDARDEVRWHPVFQDFAGYWGFTPRLCRPHQPQTKGKVESGVGYVKGNFLCGRQASGLEDLRSQALQWLSEVAMERVHGTTGRVVREAWEDEKPLLAPTHGRAPFVFTPSQARRVSRDAFVHWAGNRYSVPWQTAGKEVDVWERDGALDVWRDGRLVAHHALCQGKRQVIIAAEHHTGIPTGAHRQARRETLLVCEGAPDVVVRSLADYEKLAREGER